MLRRFLMGRRFGSVFFSLLMVAGLLVATGGTASAAITVVPGGIYRVRTGLNGRCLDADLVTLGRNGSKVQLWDCINGATNQYWRAVRIGGSATDFAFQSVRGGRYLDADLNTICCNGTKLQLWDANFDPQQVFRFSLNDNSVASVRSGRLLDADLVGSCCNGERVQLWSRINGASNQRWYFTGVL